MIEYPVPGATGGSAQAPALDELRWTDVDPSWLLVLPLGSTEQHGPYLPMGTDTTVACELARRLVQHRPDAVLAPALAYGSAGEHDAFPGTLSIGQEALVLVLVELVRSAAFRRTVVVNAHGGNAAPVARAVNRLQQEGHDVLSFTPRIEGGDPHAGRTETSLLLATSPALVAPGWQQAVPAPAARAPLATLLPALRAGRLREIAPDGVLGDPAAADAAHGEDLWRRLTADLIAAAEDRWPLSGQLR
ncbi:MAG TPA: mycofactocin biosynthesis peptidyl-dipeptidase MftE [Mycobacteriales bacterium]|nr:mycofactocin biosynthesis peptidyl-dipeptidase MftE [Mycobacteriales bacterium]